MAVIVTNTDIGLNGKTIINAEDNQTITAAKTFDRDPNPPFLVSANSAKVDNLDADKLDGLDSLDYARLVADNAFTGTISATGTINSAHGGIGAGTGGYYERSRVVPLGEWIAVAYSDANFTGDTTDANWVVGGADQVNFKYMVVGTTIFVNITVSQSTVANTPAGLVVTIPGSISAAVNAGGTMFYSDGATPGIGRWYVDTSAATKINFTKLSGNWSNATDQTVIQACMQFEIG